MQSRVAGLSAGHTDVLAETFGVCQGPGNQALAVALQLVRQLRVSRLGVPGAPQEGLEHQGAFCSKPAVSAKRAWVKGMTVMPGVEACWC